MVIWIDVKLKITSVEGEYKPMKGIAAAACCSSGTVDLLMQAAF